MLFLSHHNISICLAELYDSLYQMLSSGLWKHHMHNFYCLKHFLFFSVMSISAWIAEWLFLGSYIYCTWSHSGVGNDRGIYRPIFLKFCWYLRLLIWADNWCIPEDLLFQKLELHLQVLKILKRFQLQKIDWWVSRLEY